MFSSLNCFNQPTFQSKDPVIRATFSFNLNATLLHCKLKSVVARIITHLKHCHETKISLFQLARASCSDLLLVLLHLKQRKFNNSLLYTCRSRKVAMRDPFLHVVVNVSFHLSFYMYSCMTHSPQYSSGLPVD